MSDSKSVVKIVNQEHKDQFDELVTEQANYWAKQAKRIRKVHDERITVTEKWFFGLFTSSSEKINFDELRNIFEEVFPAEDPDDFNVTMLRYKANTLAKKYADWCNVFNTDDEVYLTVADYSMMIAELAQRSRRLGKSNGKSDV